MFLGKKTDVSVGTMQVHYNVKRELYCYDYGMLAPVDILCVSFTLHRNSICETGLLLTSIILFMKIKEIAFDLFVLLSWWRVRWGSFFCSNFCRWGAWSTFVSFPRSNFHYRSFSVPHIRFCIQTFFWKQITSRTNKMYICMWVIVYTWTQVWMSVTV